MLREALPEPSSGDAAGLLHSERVEPVEENASETSGEAPIEAEAPRAQRWAVRAGSVLGGLTLGLVVSFGVETALARGEVLRGVVVGDVALGGLDESAARARLEKRRSELAVAPLVLVLGDEKVTTSGRDLGLGVDVDAGLRAAMNAGRDGSIFSRFGGWCARLFRATHVVMPARAEARFTDALHAVTAPHLELPIVPSIGFDGELHAVYPKEGRVIDEPELRRSWSARLDAPSNEPITVPLIVRAPELSRADVDAALEKARALIAGPITLVTEDGAHEAKLSPTTLGDALTSEVKSGPPRLELGLAKERLDKALRALRVAAEKPALPARFAVDARQAITVLPSERGLRLDDDALLAAIWSASSTKDRRGVLALRVEEPSGLTVEEAEGLGIDGLVAQFVTHHACCEARVKNIHSVAAQMHGVVLRPGETFSLNQFLGPRTNEGGYFEAPTIVRGKMKATAGGGISQFATTLFNAVLNGGYEIVQRQPHSFYFPRYPEGHEATVSFPSPDLSFKNDTKFGLLIQTSYGPTFIRVLLYGNNEGRRVERKISSRYALTEPPLEYEPNLELKPDETHLVTRGQTGWSLVATRVIHYADGTKSEQKREVVYQPRPQVVEVHPCVIPQGMKGHTGEKCPEPEEPTEDEAGAEGAHEAESDADSRETESE